MDLFDDGGSPDARYKQSQSPKRYGLRKRASPKKKTTPQKELFKPSKKTPKRKQALDDEWRLLKAAQETLAAERAEFNKERKSTSRRSRRESSHSDDSEHSMSPGELRGSRLPKGTPQEIIHAVRFDRPLIYGESGTLGIWDGALLEFAKSPESRLRGAGREVLLARFLVLSEHPYLREQLDELARHLAASPTTGPLPSSLRPVVAELTVLFITGNKLSLVKDATARMDALYNMLTTQLSTLITLSKKDLEGMTPTSLVTAMTSKRHFRPPQDPHPTHMHTAGVLPQPNQPLMGAVARSSGPRVRADPDECFNCGATGHIRATCPQPRLPQPFYSRRMN
jgi:hypothetical protein